MSDHLESKVKIIDAITYGNKFTRKKGRKGYFSAPPITEHGRQKNELQCDISWLRSSPI